MNQAQDTTNDLYRRYPLEKLRQPSLASIFEKAAVERQEAVIVDDGRTALTYGELVARARALAVTLGQLDDPIGILLPISADYIIAIVAALLAGKAYVPMDDSFPAKRNMRIVTHSGMNAVIVDKRTAESMNALDSFVQRIVMPSAPLDGSVPKPLVQSADCASADRIVTIFYTSGSTGEPKGVCQSEGALVYDIEDYIGQVALGPKDRVTMLYSPSVSSSNRDIYGPLLAGARMCIIDLKSLGLAASVAAMRKHRITLYHSVPGVFRSLFGAGLPDASEVACGIRRVRLNGDRVLPSDVELYKRVFPRSSQLCLDMASTETRAYASWLVCHDTPVAGPLVPVGYLRPDLPVALIGEDGTPVARGEIGEIVVTSPSLSAGYWRDEALTRERFIRSRKFSGMVEYHTGDFGRLLPDGLLEFVGRRDRQAKVRGNTVHLDEVDAVVATCPGVADVSVVARKETAGLRLIAYCVIGPAFESIAAIRSWCRDYLSEAMCPSDVVTVDSLPKLVTGKVDLVELERFDADRARQQAAPETIAAPSMISNADAIRLTWGECFGEASFAQDMPFEDAGGDSLQAMVMLLNLERRLGRSLPNGLISRATRPSDLASGLAALASEAPNWPYDAAKPMIFLFPGIYGADFGIAGFARQLGAVFRVVLMDYRHSGADFLSPADRERVFLEFENRVSAEGTPQRLWIVGYSFGSRVAAEAARRLLERRVAVEFIAVIDGPTEAVIAVRKTRRALKRAVRPPLSKRIAEHGGIFGFVTAQQAARVAHILVSRNHFAPLRAFITLLSRLKLKAAAVQVTRVVLARTRAKAFRNLPAAPLNAPISLFVSTAPYSDSRFSPDLGWTGWCTKLDIFRLEGDHHEILEEDRAEAIMNILSDAEKRLRQSST